MAEKMKGSPKDNMLQTCSLIWKHATEKEKNLIREMLTSLLKSAKVLKWEPLSQAKNEYELELAQEVIGSHPDVPIGQLIIKKKMKIAFLEEKIKGKENYRLHIIFPDKGVCHRMGIGWLSKETPLNSIIIEQDQKQNIWCTIEGMGQKLVKQADETLKFWNKAQWT